MTLAAYPTYEAYKDSGVEWIGYVPTEWQSMRLQDVATCNDDTLLEHQYRNREIKYVDISGVSAADNTYSYEIQEFSNAPSRARRLAKAGDIVFSTVRPYLKAVATVVTPEDDLVFSTGFAIVRPKSNADQRFIGYALRNESFISEVSAHSVGASYPAINASDLFKLKIPLPPLLEQRAIAAFLDEKCAKVDEAVRIRREQITLLQERRRILIQRAITRGLNPQTLMKASGIDWIGQIPAHWQTVRFKYLFTQSRLPVRTDDGVVTAYRDGQVTLRANRRIDGYTEAILESGYQGIRVGQLVLNSMDAFEGAIGVSDSEGKCTPEYVICDPLDDSINQYYFAYLLREMALADYIEVICNAVRQRAVRIRFNNLASRFLVLPPAGEQAEIVEFIEVEKSKIADAITIKQDQIAALKEYKTSLINSAVTGKIRVIEGA